LTTGIFYHWKREYETANEYLNKISPQSWAKTFFLGLNNVANNKSDKAVEILKTLYPDFEHYDGGSKALLA
jgi:hypothetical protein